MLHQQLQGVDPDSDEEKPGASPGSQPFLQGHELRREIPNCHRSKMLYLEVPVPNRELLQLSDSEPRDGLVS